MSLVSVVCRYHCSGDRRVVLTSEELGLEVHLVEGVNGLIVVGLNLSCNGEYKLAICLSFASRCCECLESLHAAAVAGMKALPLVLVMGREGSAEQ